MRQLRDYKKQKKLASWIIVFTLLAMPLAFPQAQTEGELREKIDEKSSEIEELEAQIKKFQSELNSLGQQKDSLNRSIQELDVTRKKLNADISVTQKRIDQTNFKIQGLSKDISTKEGSISTATEAIMLDIRKTNELEQTTLLETILSDQDFTEVWTDIDNMIAVREKIRENINTLREVKVELEDTRDETIEAKNELTALRSKLADQRKIVEQNTKEKNTLLSQTKNSEASYQKLVAEQTAKKMALERELQEYESQLKYILDPKSLPTNRPLGWPLDSIFITSPFGPRWGGFHSGTDFRAPVGTPVRAMASGTVMGAGDTDLTCRGASFGKWVFIEYDNGLASTYGHLSLTKAVRGQKVSRGDIVGYSGNTGSSTGPHLHVTVYAPNAAQVQTLPSKSCLGKTLTQPLAATNAYLDPMKYLPPYSS